jgi:hypothetical protein
MAHFIAWFEDHRNNLEERYRTRITTALPAT